LIKNQNQPFAQADIIVDYIVSDNMGDLPHCRVSINAVTGLLRIPFFLSLSNCLFKYIKHIIEELKTHRQKEERLQGNLKNRLIEYL